MGVNDGETHCELRRPQLFYIYRQAPLAGVITTLFAQERGHFLLREERERERARENPQRGEREALLTMRLCISSGIYDYQHCLALLHN